MDVHTYAHLYPLPLINPCSLFSMDSLITRREMLKSTVAAGIGLVLLSPLESFATPAETSEMATGMVFESPTGSGVRTPGARGIAGVLVSNGRDVVRTDADGRYRLSISDGDVLFIIKPSGWSTPMTEYHLPRFYYVHRPKGSPQYLATDVPGADRLNPTWFYKGTAPTGPLPASIDFALQRSPEPDEFTTIVFGDTQVSHDKQIDYMARGTVSELLNAPGIAFGISVGDLVNVGLLHLFGPLNELQAKTGFPWYTLPGNHDQNLVTPGDFLAEEQYRTTYGPTVYAFEYGPVSFLMIGNVRRTPFAKLDKPDAPAGTGVPAPAPYHCGLRDEQWSFVEQYLQTVPTDRQLVISMHMDMKGPDPKTGSVVDILDSPESINHTEVFTRRLMGLISGRPHTLSISGHTHINRHLFFGSEIGFTGPGQHHHFNTICVRGAGYRGMFNELQIPSCQAEDGVPAGYSYVTFTKDSYRIRYKPSRHPADYQMNVFVPAVMHPRQVAGTTVLANVFASSERSTVKMRLNGGAWEPMTFNPQADPSIAWVISEEKTPTSWLGSKYNPNDTPATAYHIWEGNLPGNLPEGTHTLEIESIDMFGQRDTEATFFRVLAA